MGLRAAILAVVAVAILAISAGAIYYITTPAPSSTTTTPQTTATTVIQTTTTTTTTPSTHTVTVSPTSPAGPIQPRITDIVPEGFVFVDDELYWRIKIFGEADLRNKIEINGVYSFWFGRFNITLPDGSLQDRIHEPGNYVDIVSNFRYIPGVMTLDIYIPTKWWETICLEGVYRVVVWLKGPYNNYTVLYSKNFTYRFSPSISFKPTRWSSWNEAIEFKVDNRGDIPLIIHGGDFVLSGTDTVIGWWALPSETIVMPGESRVLKASIEILSDFREWLRGKTRAVDINIEITGAPRRYTITTDIEFPPT